MVDPRAIKAGDILYESEYGSTVQIEALEDAEIHEDENYWTFRGRTQKRGIVQFRGQLVGRAYDPDLYGDDIYQGFCTEPLVPLHTVAKRGVATPQTNATDGK